MSESIMWITHFYRSDRFKFKQRPYKQNITDMNTTTYDNRLEDAARVIVRQQVGSTSNIMRKLGLGYAKSSCIMEQLELLGIVGAKQPDGCRPVLVQTEVELENILKEKP